MQVLNWFDYLSIFFIDAGENLVMTDDVTTPSNLLVTPVEKEKIEDAPLDEAPFDINVSQRLREEELSKRVVRTRVTRLAWDRRFSPTHMP
jgi:hypothetical protein